MKFWQLVCIVHRERDTLQAVIGESKWHPYGGWLADIDAHFEAQDRKVLDATLPDDLCRLVFGGLRKEYRLQDNWLKEAPAGGATGPEERLTVLEAFDRFGVWALVSVEEYGEFPLGESSGRRPDHRDQGPVLPWPSP